MQQPFSAKLALSSAMFYLKQYSKRDPFQNALLVPPEPLLKAGNNVYILCFSGKYEQVLPILYQRSEFSACAPSQVAVTFAQCWARADEPCFPWLPTFQLNSLHAQHVSFHLGSMRLAVRAGCFPLPLQASVVYDLTQWPLLTTRCFSSSFKDTGILAQGTTDSSDSFVDSGKFTQDVVTEVAEGRRYLPGKVV